MPAPKQLPLVATEPFCGTFNWGCNFCTCISSTTLLIGAWKTSRLSLAGHKYSKHFNKQRFAIHMPCNICLKQNEQPLQFSIMMCTQGGLVFFFLFFFFSYSNLHRKTLDRALKIVPLFCCILCSTLVARLARCVSAALWALLLLRSAHILSAAGLSPLCVAVRVRDWLRSGLSSTHCTPPLSLSPFLSFSLSLSSQPPRVISYSPQPRAGSSSTW